MFALPNSTKFGDIERLGHADDVVLVALSEFGRRVPENANRGTDHGTAGPMFIAGSRYAAARAARCRAWPAAPPTTPWCTQPIFAASTLPSRTAGLA